MKRSTDIKGVLRMLGILLAAEGGLMGLCVVPALHFGDGTVEAVALCAAFTLATGGLLWLSYSRYRRIDDRRMAYLMVTLIWLVLTLFAALPLMATGATTSPSKAWFEAMSGLTASGGTIFADVSALPASVLMWRSMTQWLGGFGIVLLVLAVSPRLGVNRYALYTAEASGADITGRRPVSTAVTIRRTLTVYLSLTAVFIAALWFSGLPIWEAVNLTFTNISSGGFATSSTSLSELEPVQQYLLAAAMLLSGVNFTLLYLFFTLRWRQIGHKLEQFGTYISIFVAAALFVVGGLHWHMGLEWGDALRLGTVQTVSALTTTGSAVADTTQWWTPLTFLLLILSICGGMAGSTSGGLKVMRVLILMRNARSILRGRLHPRAVAPLRLNRQPVSSHIRGNVMVIFIVYATTLMLGTMGLMLCGVSATESIGAAVGCLTGYGPGLGASGGFGSYAAFTPAALWLCSFLMLLGRLECMTVLVLFLPRFWHR